MAHNDSENTIMERNRSALETFAKDYKIFIDTCSLLHPNIDKLWANLVPLLQTYNNKVILSLRVCEELQKKANDKSQPDLAARARKASDTLGRLQKANLLDLRGEPGDNFADNVFLTVFTKFRMNYRLLLITQDIGLATDLLKLNESRAVRAYPVKVKKVHSSGFLTNLNINNTDVQKGINPSGGKNRFNTINPNEVFDTKTSVTHIDDTRGTIRYIPAENDTVYTAAGPVVLRDKVSAGGEGIIYNTNSPFVAKIYSKEKNTKRKFEKIKRMLSKSIKFDGICYPVDILYNSNKEFVGYLMPKAKGKEIQKCLFIKALLLKNFPHWKKRDTVELCITILNKIKYLHDRNIIMGDINPANILIVSPKEVYFVDTDSYQIEDFPCPVGTVNYTAPEIQKKNFGNFLRTTGNENFAVATLLFMLMVPGKPPYAQQGGDDPASNIINMNFSYPLGEKTNKKTPEGPWRFIWSHLPYRVKDAFYNTFRKEGEYAAEDKRLSVKMWLNIFTNYLELLDSGKLGENDKKSEEIFPDSYKKSRNLNYVVCRLCKNEVQDTHCKNGICNSCLKLGEAYNCKKCGKQLVYTNFQKYIKNAVKRDICDDCIEYNRSIRLTQSCSDCGTTFTITNGEYDSFVKKGLTLPKRCKACRDIKKNRSVSKSYISPGIFTEYPFKNSYSYKNTSSEGGPSSSKTSNSSSSNDSLCFISTAVCDYYGKPDDCSELNALRNYRDTWLVNSNNGRALIAEYYALAPAIVGKLKASPNYGAYCRMLWNKYILPCIKYIKAKKYEECKNLYVKMVRYMQSEFLN